MKKLLLSLGAIALLAVAGVAAIPLIKNDGPGQTLSIDPPDYPAEGMFDFPKPHTSQIAAHLELPIDVLTAAANRNAPKELAGAENKNFHQLIKNGAVQWRMFPGAISLQNTGQNLGFSLPIQGLAKFTGNFDAAIIRLPIQGDADLGGYITGTVTPHITSDWVIEPDLKPELNLSHANLSLAGLGTIGATGMIQDLVNPLIKKEAESVGPSIMQGLDLRRNLQRLWDEAHRGEQVSENPPAWFVFDPGTVSMGPIDYSKSGSIAVTLGMAAQSYLSSVPVNLSYPEPLPPLSLTNGDPVNDIRIPVIIDVEELNKKLAIQTSTQSFGMGGKATVSRPEIRVGRKGFLIFGVTVDADTGKWGQGFNGRIWFEVKPGFNYDTQTISLAETRLTDGTRAALPGPAVAMIEGIVVKSIEKELQENIDHHLPKMEKGIQDWLSSGKLPENVEIQIPNPDLKIVDFYTVTRPAQDAEPSPGIVIVLGAKGDIIVQMKTL